MDALKLIGLLTQLTRLLEGFTPILNDLIAKEKAKTGLTEDEITAKSLVTVDETDVITDKDAGPDA